MQIDRIESIITTEQLIKILELAVSSKTDELEIAAAQALSLIQRPTYIYKDDSNADR